MDDKAINVWAKRFAADLNVAGEPAIFDQVVDKHLDTLSLLKTSLRWRSIRNVLVRAGARRSDGVTAFSEDQLRASYRRMRLRRATTKANLVVPDAAVTSRRLSGSQTLAVQPESQFAPHQPSPSHDVSEAEIELALQRIHKHASNKKGSV